MHAFPLRRTAIFVSCVLVLAACHRDDATAADTTTPTTAAAPAAPPPAPATSTMAQPDAQMQAVLDQLAKLGAKPIETLTPEQARAQPSPADAVKAVLKAQGKPTTPEPVAKVRDSSFPGPGG